MACRPCSSTTITAGSVFLLLTYGAILRTAMPVAPMKIMASTAANCSFVHSRRLCVRTCTFLQSGICASFFLIHARQVISLSENSFESLSARTAPCSVKQITAMFMSYLFQSFSPGLVRSLSDQGCRIHWKM